MDLFNRIVTNIFSCGLRMIDPTMTSTISNQNIINKIKDIFHTIISPRFINMSINSLARPIRWRTINTIDLLFSHSQMYCFNKILIIRSMDTGTAI